MPIIILTLLALLVRIPTLDIPLVGDHRSSFAWHAFLPWKTLFFSYDNHHPLYVALARLAMGIFGESEVTFILPALLAGIFCVPLLYSITLTFFHSRKVAATASFLLIFSFESIYYSQHGRGYSLTMFLALTMIYLFIKIIENQSAWLKYCVLPILGLCMALTLPTNGNIFAAGTVFFIILKWDERAGIKNHFNAAFLKELLPFGIAFLLMGAYFLTILSDLKLLVKYMTQHMGTLEFTAGWVGNVSSFLVEPWGVWLYLFFAYGLFVFKRDSRFFAFLSIFLAPFTLTFISKTFGPPRIYVYWIPFVMMFVALGIVHFVDLISAGFVRGSTSKASDDGQASALISLPGVLLALSVIALTVQPVLKLNDYYQSRLGRGEKIAEKGIKIADAKQALSYLVETEGNSHNLIVLARKNGILSHYLAQKALENNFRVIKDGKLDKIIFVGEYDVPPQKYLVSRNLLSDTYRFPDNMFKTEKIIGTVAIHQLMRKTSKVDLPQYYNDDESRFTSKEETVFSMERHGTPYSEKAGIKIVKKTDKEILVVFPEKVPVQGSENDYALLMFVQKYNKSSKAFLAEEYDGSSPVKGKPLQSGSVYGPPNISNLPYGFEMNYFADNFISEETKITWKPEYTSDWIFRNILNISPDSFYPTNDLWEIRLTLYPLYKEKHEFMVGFYLQGASNLFDGVQLWALSHP